MVILYILVAQQALSQKHKTLNQFCLMLAHSLQLWANVKSTLVLLQHLVFAGVQHVQWNKEAIHFPQAQLSGY